MEEPHTPIESVEEHSAKTAEMLRSMRAEADQALESHRRIIGDIESDLSQRIHQIAEELARDQAADEIEAAASHAQREELSKSQEALHNAEAEIAARAEQLQQLSQDRDQLAGQLEELGTQRELLQNECDQLGGELQAAQEALDSVREEQGRESARFNEELTAARESHSQALEKTESLEAQLQARQQEHEQTCQALEETRTAGDESTSELNNELTQNKQLVGELNEKLEQQKTEHERRFDEQKEEIEQSNRKCELALADVHKLKRANAELHEELVRRPESNDQDSPELVSLRAERDTLAGRVEELASAPMPKLDDDSQQELSDLQRRFEMAVEDVRSLKQENASLREQLKASPAAPVGASDDDMGWQAQKARLLASLDAEDVGQVTPQRREERSTIEGTISITDRVVSEKDQEIVELKAQLQERPAETKSEAQVEAAREEALRVAHEELFSKDEMIQTERSRLEQLQHEWKDKLRTAELDISVQRATLAREQAKLKEQLDLLESQTAEVEKSGGKPKHRWLSALGLRDEEEDED